MGGGVRGGGGERGRATPARLAQIRKRDLTRVRAWAEKRRKGGMTFSDHTVRGGGGEGGVCRTLHHLLRGGEGGGKGGGGILATFSLGISNRGIRKKRK